MKKNSLDDPCFKRSRTSHRIAIAAQLSASRVEVAENIYRHIQSGEQPVEIRDGSCTLGVKRAIGEAIKCVIDSIEKGEHQPMPIPAAVSACARQAAWHGIPLETVMGSLILGHTLLSEALCGESANLPGDVMRQLLALEGAVIGRLSTVVAREYREERRRASASETSRQHILVERLLSGTRVDEDALGYPLEGWHIALVAEGTEAADVVRGLAHALGEAVLVIPGEGQSLWAWIGSRKEFAGARITKAMEGVARTDVKLALGQPAQGPAGYRSAHAEALAAFAVASHRPSGVTIFATVALEAMALQAPEVAKSLHTAYLRSLDGPSGSKLRETLVAYFAAQRNVSSTAALLGVTRRTIENRLQTIESRLGRPVQCCGAELEVALRLDELFGSEPLILG